MTPSFIYGTAWKEDRTEALTGRALAAGFRAIDTANQRRHYVEAGVGAAVARALDLGGLTRDELFLQTKFTAVGGQDHRLPYDPHADVATQVEQSFESSLGHLRTSYLDSLILHGPNRAHGLDDADWAAWRAMEALQEAGRVRFIGVSNVSLAQLRQLHAGSQVRPAFVQNRCFARQRWDHGVRAFCTARGIAYQGFSLLTANEREIYQPAVASIAERHGRTVPQVVFRFALQAGMLPLTGTSSEAHMREDLACLEFQLDEAELQAIEDCGLTSS
ncbi:MAG TPA: aldo/keto reductase [Vicinamibacteria bacterium]